MAKSGNGALWTGRVLSGLVVLFMLFEAVIKLIKIPAVVKAFAQEGFPLSDAVTFGLLALIITVLYAIPRTSVLGAILLTGYLGGATAINLRTGMPVYFPVIFGVIVWGGLYLRDSSIRALIPLRR